jgi:hypothetical protein
MPLLHHINAVIAGLRALIGFMSDPYRPELHYMRGPGPKWRARHMHASP